MLKLEPQPPNAYSPAWSCVGTYIGDYDTVADVKAACGRYWLTSSGVMLDVDKLGESLSAAIVEDYKIEN